MLSPQDRQKLDSIVLKMSENNESPADIQFVVDDFKKKYENQVVTPAQQVAKEPDTLLEKAGGFVKDVARDITKPVVQTLAAPAQLAAYGIDKATGGNSPVEDFAFTMPFWGEIAPAKTNEEAVGRGVQTVALGLGPVSGSAAYMGGQAMTENKGVGGVALDTVIGGVTGKVGEVATKAVGTILSKSGKAMQTAGAGYDALINSAKKNYETVLGPTTKANKRITQQITGELAERQVTATTRQELWDKAAGQVEKYGEQIQEFYKGLPEDTKVRTDGILKAIDAAKRKLFVKGEGAYMIPEVNKALFKKYQDLQIEIMSMAKNGNAPIEGVRALRQALDKSIAKTTSTFGITGEESIITEARKGVSNILRNELAKQFPDVAVINKEFTFWSRVQQVLGDTIERKVGQGTPLGEKIMTAAGGAAGIGSGGVSTGISTAIGIKYLYQLTKSTAWQTLAASMKTKLANALVEGDGMTFSKVMNDVLKASGYVIEKTGNILKATPEVLKNAPRKAIPGTSEINLKGKAKTLLDNVKGKGGLSIEDVSKKKDKHIFDGLVKNIQTGGSGMKVSELNPVDFDSFKDTVKTKEGRATVDYLKEKILNGEKPKIKIKQGEDGKIFVEDGHHTVQAYKELGYENIPTDSIKGSARISTILSGATGTGALAAGVAGVKTLQDNSLNGKTFENKKLGTTILDGKSDAPAVKESDGISQNQLNIGNGEKAKNEVIATVVAEAIGEGDEGMQIVLNTINNRASEKKKTMHQVVKDQAQFSAYGNELFKKVMGLLNGSPTPFKDATEKMFIEKAVKKVKELIESGKIEDLTNGATHYWNTETAKSQEWMNEGEYTLKKGKHVFKKGIRYSVRD